MTVLLSLCLALVFCVVCAYAFFKLGQIAGIEVRSQSPRAIVLSVTSGAISAVGTLFALSLLNINGPWQLVAIPLLLPLRPRWYFCLAAIAVVFAASCSHYTYSPYRKIELRPVNGAILVVGNGVLYQSCMTIPDEKELDRLASKKYVTNDMNQLKHYLGRLSLPMVAAPNKDEVLILGAGCGNDVAFALEYGAGKIDAVELDPTLIDIGKTNHPNRPYASPKVAVYNTDPRRFLTQTDKKYDLIQFAFINDGRCSNTYYDLSGDSFVYTIECLEMAVSKLKRRGVVVISFACPQNAVATQKLLATVTNASGSTFSMKQHDYDVYDLAPQYSFFTLGPAVKRYNKTTFTPKVTRFIYLSRMESDRADLACSDSCPFPNYDRESADALPLKLAFLILSIVAILVYNCDKQIGAASKACYVAVGAFWAASNYSIYVGSMLQIGAVWYLPLLIVLTNGILLFVSSVLPNRLYQSKFFSPMIFLLTICGIIGIIQIDDNSLRLVNALILTMLATMFFYRRLFSADENREVVLGLTLLGYSLGVVCSLFAVYLGARQILVIALSAGVILFTTKKQAPKSPTTVVQ